MFIPKDSMKVDLPAPGTPVIPILIELFFPERLAKVFLLKFDLLKMIQLK